MSSPNLHFVPFVARLAWLCVVLSCFGSLGCKQWPGAAQINQYQSDNDRLLSEFRAQKKRADELQSRNDQLAKRLDESERQIASLNLRSNQRMAQSDSSSRRLTSGRLEGPVPNSLPDESYAKDPKSLPPPLATSGIRASTASSASDPSRNLEGTSSTYGKPRWKPSRKAQGLNPPSGN